MVPGADLIPVWVGFGLLLTFAVLAAVASGFCVVCVAVDVAKEMHDD